MQLQETILKSKRLTSSKLNRSKMNEIKLLEKEALSLKNKMSELFYENRLKLYNISSAKHLPSELSAKQFKSNYFKAWNVQKIFLSVATTYLNHITDLKGKLDLRVSDGTINVTYYKKNGKCKSGKTYHKGGVKSVEQVKRWTPLAKLIKYLLKCNVNNNEEITNCLVKKPELLSLYLKLTIKVGSQRIINLLNSIKETLLLKIKKPHEFRTGSFFVIHKINKTSCSNLIYKEKNDDFHYWFKFDVRTEFNKKGYIAIPLDVPKGFKKDDWTSLRRTEWIVKPKRNKVDIISTVVAEEPTFTSGGVKIVGIDLNVKHNFCAIYDGTEFKEFDYNRTWINKVVQKLKEFDKKGTRNLTDLDKRRLSNLCKANEGYFKKLIHDIIQHLVKNNVTDVVLEDLSVSKATFIKNEEFEIKYSRLIKLLRLSNIKNWFISQAEKQHIRVHLTPSHYTSKQCPVCGCIDDENRPTQETFVCTCCGHANNADFNAAQNIRFRFIHDSLRTKLHKLDKFNRMEPKDFIRKDYIKKMCVEAYKSG